MPAPAPALAVADDEPVTEPSVEGETTPARLARRFRRRRHLDQRPGTVEVVLDELVSPLRYDVIVRQEFFAFLDANAELLEEFGDLVLEAKSKPYYVWYRDIVIGDRGSCSRAAALDGAFADQIERVLAVRARFNPADESWGDLLRRQSRPVPAPPPARRWAPASSPSTAATASRCSGTMAASSCRPARTASSATSSRCVTTPRS